MVKRYFWNLLIAIDQLANTMIGGDPDETISSRAGKSRSAVAYALCRVLHLFDPDHCKKSIEPDEGKNATL